MLNNKPSQQFLELVSNPRIQKRIISAKRYQSVYYSLLGQEIASKHTFYRRGKPVQTEYVVHN